MLTTEQIDRLLSQGANVLSGDGEKIGSLGQVFVDNDEGQPRWATVKTGLFGMSESFVPLDGARTEGGDLVVPYSKDQVKDAPRIDADRPLEPAEEDRLYQHYQLDRERTYTEASAATSDFSAPPVGARDDTGTDRVSASETTTPVTAAPSGGAGYDTTTPTPSAQRDDTGTDRVSANETTTTPVTAAPSGAAGYDTTPSAQRDDTATPTPTARLDDTAPTGSMGYDATAPAPRDDTGTDGISASETTAPPVATADYDTTAPTGSAEAATGSEKRPDVGTEQPATGRARLRKYVTTETVTGTVPVQREEVRIEREPITEENRDEVLNRADKDDQGDVILHEERIVVTKETVPVERIHIGTETVTDEVTINEEVRKEHLDTEGEEGTEESRR
jgi:uncharacterized protein (TIGR02271 family)